MHWYSSEGFAKLFLGAIWRHQNWQLWIQGFPIHLRRLIKSSQWISHYHDPWVRIDSSSGLFRLEFLCYVFFFTQHWNAITGFQAAQIANIPPQSASGFKKDQVFNINSTESNKPCSGFNSEQLGNMTADSFSGFQVLFLCLNGRNTSFHCLFVESTLWTSVWMHQRIGGKRIFQRQCNPNSSHWSRSLQGIENSSYSESARCCSERIFNPSNIKVSWFQRRSSLCWIVHRSHDQHH